jgi:hypothetical protein
LSLSVDQCTSLIGYLALTAAVSLIGTMRPMYGGGAASKVCLAVSRPKFPHVDPPFVLLRRIWQFPKLSTLIARCLQLTYTLIA